MIRKVLTGILLVVFASIAITGCQGPENKTKTPVRQKTTGTK